MSSSQIFFASIPPYKSRSKLSPPTVDRCLSHWSAALHTLRHLPDPSFTQQLTPKSPFTKFLSSYISNDDLSHSDTDDWVYPSTLTGTTNPQDATTTAAAKAKYINRCIRLCLKRAVKLGVIDDIIPSSRAYIKLAALFFTEGGSKPLLRSIWSSNQPLLQNALKAHLKSLSETFNDLSAGKEPPSTEHTALLQELSYFVMSLPEISYEILSDQSITDSLTAVYYTLQSQKGQVATEISEEILRLQFTIIMAATQAEGKRYSAVVDFLFNTAGDAETDVTRSLYVTAVISQTPLLDRLKAIDAEGYANRWSTVLSKLQKFDTSTTKSSSKRMTKLPRRKQKFRKQPVDLSAMDISQKLLELQELFPSTETSILEATLTSTNYDLEAATMSLLDNPSQDPRSSYTYTDFALAPPTTNPRDELDTLAVPTHRLYMGKRDISGTADNLLKDRASAPSKDKILAALQAFDSDEDERDDTYDQGDVGGAVDTTAVDSEAVGGNNVAAGGAEERALYKALVGNPDVFARDAKTRRGLERKELRDVTGMTDEAVEGWKIMLDRDGGKRLRQLEIRFSRESDGGAASGSGGQSTLQRTAYRKGDEDEEEDGAQGEGGSGNATAARGGGGHRGRGGRRFAGPNDRNVTGQQRDHAAVVSDGKEPYVGKKTSKARGEHNRKMQSAARDRQRTKKMGKGM